MADTKALAEVKALETFYHVLSCDSAKAFYGIKHVEAANEHQAIETLLISDHLFRCVIFILICVITRKNKIMKWFVYRSDNVDERKRYVRLVDSVKEYGGDVKIFSSMHISGERKF